MLPPENEPPIEGELLRPVPRPRREFEQRLETKLLQAFDQYRTAPSQKGFHMNLSRVPSPSRPLLARATPSLVFGVALMTLIATLIVALDLTPTDQALSVVPITPASTSVQVHETSVYALTNTYRTWRHPADYGLVIIPSTQIEFSAVPLRVGETATIATDADSDPLTRDALVVEINRGIFTITPEYYALLVPGDANTLHQLVAARTQFRLSETPENAQDRLTLVTLPFGSVLEASATSQSMNTCAQVDVLGVESASSEQASPQVTSFGRDARVFIAPIIDTVSWAMQMNTADEAAAVQYFVNGGGQIYLHPACD